VEVVEEDEVEEEVEEEVMEEVEEEEVEEVEVGRLDRGRGPNLLSACLQINKKKNTKTDPKLYTKTGT
jgi:hypothetical protein